MQVPVPGFHQCISLYPVSIRHSPLFLRHIDSPLYLYPPPPSIFRWVASSWPRTAAINMWGPRGRIAHLAAMFLSWAICKVQGSILFPNLQLDFLKSRTVEYPAMRPPSSPLCICVPHWLQYTTCLILTNVMIFYCSVTNAAFICYLFTGWCYTILHGVSYAWQNEKRTPALACTQR